MLTFGNKINRSYSLYLPFMKDSVTISIMFNKMNTFLGFNIDQKIYQAGRNNELHSNIYKDLKESSFATTFLDIKSFKSKNLDIKFQFNNIRPEFRTKIQYITNETIKVSKVQTANGPFESVLYVYIFNFLDYEDDFIYVLAERQHIDTALGKKLVRTCGLQLCSNEAHENLMETVQYYNTKLVESEDTNDVLKEVLN